MKNLSIVAVVLLCFTIGSAQHRTDSDVKRDFEKTFIFLTKSLNNTESPDTLKHLLNDLTEFEREFKPYREFLNRAVYPDGYDGLIDRVKKSKELAEHKIHAAQLEKEVSSLTAQVQSLTEENASLRSQLSKAQKELLSLKKEIAVLQEEVRKRDEAVFALVDSLFIKYDRDQITGNDMKKLTVLERKNVVASLKRTVQDNMAFLSSSSFSAGQIPQLLNEQRRFESSWNGLAGKLSKAYVPASAQGKEIAEITSSIAQWHTMTDEVFWRGLNEIFASENLPIEKFSNGDEMFKNIVKYLTLEIADNWNRSSSEKTKTFEAFAYKTWGSKIKPSWIPVMIRNGMFTEDQMNMIDAKSKEWQAGFQPVDNNSMISILAVAFILAILVGAYLGTKRRKV